MRYGAVRRQGLYVGSRVIEAGCRTVIASRLKLTEMAPTLGTPAPSIAT